MAKGWLAALAFGIALSAGAYALAQDARPATKPAGELLQEKAAMPGYGIESYRIVNGKDEIVSVLRNGATVICKRVASPVAAIRGYALTGGVYEGKWLGGGLSHLLEHLVAGGSSERRSEAENRALLQTIGNDSNAYTSIDHTAYFVNTTTPHFDQAVDLVTGWMLGAKITPSEYRREYQVVQRELERGKSNPDLVFAYLTADNRYKVNPARVPVIGYQEVIQGLKRDDVYEYYKIAYQPNNMVFAVAANLDPEDMLKTLQRNLAEYKPGREFSHDVAAEPPVVSPRTIVATFPKLGPARMELAFPSIKLSGNDLYALDLLSEALGGGESSILVEQIRDNQQLCSAISCSDETPSFVDGTFAIELHLDPDQISAATSTILAELEKVKSHGISEERLARFKTQMRIARVRALQTSEGVAESMALDYISAGDVHFSDRYIDRIDAVTADQVKAAANKYLDPNKLLTTVLMPREAVGAQGLPKAEDMLRPAVATTQAVAAAATDSTASRTVLDNGLVVLHRQITTTPMVAVKMYALGGLTAEDASTNGLSNLALNMLRHGTKTRTEEQIANFFDSTGADFRTRCTNNHWDWSISCMKDDFPRTMEVFADVVNNPTMPAKQFQQIQARTLAQIAGEDAAWDAQAFKFFKKEFFGPQNLPYQFTYNGAKSTVSGFTGDQALQWYQQKILTAPRVVAIYGDISKDAAIDLARKYFGDSKVAPVQPIGDRPAHETASDARETPSINVKRVEVQKSDLNMAGVIIGFQSDGYVGESDDSIAAVAQTLTGGYAYPTGYIFKILRDNGWVYEAASINMFGRSAKMPGAFIGYAGCDPQNVNKVANVILQSVARLQGSDQDIETEWFENSKRLITTFHALETETPADQAEEAALDELYGLGFDYHAKFADRIDQVDIASVRALAREHLRNCVVTICTPSPQTVDIHPGIHRFESFPYVDLTPRGIQHDSGSGGR
jgi:zinc protease